MDNFVRDILESWNLGSYIDVFEENEVTRINFHLLTKDVIAELIPKVGPRSVFLTEFRKLQRAEKSLVSNSSFEDSVYNAPYSNMSSMNNSSRALSLVPFRYPNNVEMETNLNNAENQNYRYNNRAKFEKMDVSPEAIANAAEPELSVNNNKKNSLSFALVSEEEPIIKKELNYDSDKMEFSECTEDTGDKVSQSSNATEDVEQTSEIYSEELWNFDIREILKKTNSGREVLQLLNTQNLTNDYRYKLTRILIAELVKRFGPYPSRDVKEKLAASIIKYFPFLQDEDGGYQTWFCRGKKHKSSSGYLEERLRNHRKKYYKNKNSDMIDDICLPPNTKKKLKKNSNTSSTSSLEPKENTVKTKNESSTKNTLKENKSSTKNTLKENKSTTSEVNLISNNQSSDSEEVDEVTVVSYNDYCVLKNELETLKVELEHEKELRQNLTKFFEMSIDAIKKEGPLQKTPMKRGRPPNRLKQSTNNTISSEQSTNNTISSELETDVTMDCTEIRTECPTQTGPLQKTPAKRGRPPINRLKQSPNNTISSELETNVTTDCTEIRTECPAQTGEKNEFHNDLEENNQTSDSGLTTNFYSLKKCNKFEENGGKIYLGGIVWIPEERWKSILEIPKDHDFVKALSNIIIGRENMSSKEMLKQIPQDKLELMKDGMMYRLRNVSPEERSERMSNVEFYLKQHIWDLVRFNENMTVLRKKNY